MGAHETIGVVVEDGIATLTLQRPKQLNTFNAKMGSEVFGTIGELDADDSVRVIVVTGAGRAFCAGADLDASGETFGAADWSESRQREDRVRPWMLCTPIIAAINGPAVGIGSTMPLGWDLRIASDRARFSFPFTRRGITPEAGSSWILPRLVGMSTALDLMLTGRMIGADEALRIGLVSRLVPHDELMGTVGHIARDLATNAAPVSVALTKNLLWRQLMDGDPNKAQAREDSAFEWTSAQHDTVEGVRAFMEKRSPQWTMRAPSDLPPDLLDPR